MGGGWGLLNWGCGLPVASDPRLGPGGVGGEPRCHHGNRLAASGPRDVTLPPPQALACLSLRGAGESYQGAPLRLPWCAGPAPGPGRALFFCSGPRAQLGPARASTGVCLPACPLWGGLRPDPSGGTWGFLETATEPHNAKGMISTVVHSSAEAPDARGCSLSQNTDVLQKILHACILACMHALHALILFFQKLLGACGWVLLEH